MVIIFNVYLKEKSIQYIARAVMGLKYKTIHRVLVWLNPSVMIIFISREIKNRLNTAPLPFHGAPGASEGWMADVDVALDGKSQRQPNRRRVKQIGDDFNHHSVGITSGKRSHRFAVVAERV